MGTEHDGSKENGITEHSGGASGLDATFSLKDYLTKTGSGAGVPDPFIVHQQDQMNATQAIILVIYSWSDGGRKECELNPQERNIVRIMHSFGFCKTLYRGLHGY